MRFDPNTVEDQEFMPIPADTYRVIASEGKLKDTKAGTGKYVSVKFQIVSGPFKDRIFFGNFNVQNPSEKAQQIGRAQFKRFLAAYGITQAVDIDDRLFAKIVNKPIWAEVDNEEYNGQVQAKPVRFASLAERAPQPAAPAKSAVPDLPEPSLDDIPF